MVLIYINNEVDNGEYLFPNVLLKLYELRLRLNKISVADIINIVLC